MRFKTCLELCEVFRDASSHKMRPHCNQQGEGRAKVHSPACCLLLAGFLLGVIFDPEGDGNMYSEMLLTLMPDYTALCTWQWKLS
jgi:hypothetical protein